MNIGEPINLDGIGYTVVEKIGDGGFGEVFKATPITPTAGSLAVKVLLPQYANDEEWRRRFEREARILANINHPHVVRIRAVLQHQNGSLAIAQDFFENASNMREYFRSTQDVQKHLSVALQVLYGLREAHSSAGGGAIHRDLSPSNVLVDADGHARIIDFGLAKGLRSNSKVSVKGRGYGTPGCVSPEQREDFANVTHLTDFFALGRTLAACYQDRGPEHADCLSLPPPWNPVCVKMTQYNATDRHQSCDEIIEDLLGRFINFQNDGAAMPIVPANMELHAEEFLDWSPPPHSWMRVVRHYIKNYIQSYDYAGDKSEVEAVLERLTPPIITHQEFDLVTLFHLLETQLWEPLYGGSFHASFSSTDGFGDLLRAWLPSLDTAGKLLGFRRLVRTAVGYNRFHLMGHVRMAYREEPDTGIKAEYVRILNEEDPEQIIHGGNTIPERVP